MDLFLLFVFCDFLLSPTTKNIKDIFVFVEYKQTTKQTGSYFKWIICVQLPRILDGNIGELKKFQHLFQETFKDDLDEFYMQLENTSQNPHLQGAIKTSNRMRHSTLVNLFGKTLEFKHAYIAPARHWEAAKVYAMKADTRQAGPWTHKKPFDHKADAKLNSFVMITWQRKMYDYWMDYDADSRILTWIWESEGNSGIYLFSHSVGTKAFASIAGGLFFDRRGNRRFSWEPKKC